jgi:signal transduction histidine kinase
MECVQQGQGRQERRDMTEQQLTAVLDQGDDDFTSNPQAVLQTLEALRLSWSHSTSSIACRALILLSRCCYQLARLSEAVAYSEEAMRCLDASCSSMLAAKIRNVHAGILIQLGRYAESFAILERAALDASEAQDSDMLGLVLVNQGSAVALLGDYRSGIDYFVEARRIISTSTIAQRSSRAIAQANIAETWLLEADEANGAGDLAEARARASDSLTAAQVAIEESMLLQDSRGRLNALNTLVRAAVLAGELEAAEQELARTAAALPVELHDDIVLVASRMEVDLARGRFTDIRPALMAFEERLRTAGAEQLHFRVVQMLAEVHEHTGHLDLAIAAHRQTTSTLLQLRRKVAEEQARRWKQTAISARDDALAFLAHDIRAPLGTIVAMPSAGDAAKGFAQRVKALATSALSMTDKFLEIARLDRISPNLFESIELASLLDDVCEAARAGAGADGKHIDLSVEFGHSVSGHRESLRRAFANLLDNAVRVTPRGGTVRAGLEARPGGTLVVRIIDGGPGMPVSAQAVLRRTVDSEVMATGGRFGLAIVARVARVHALRIAIEVSPSGSHVAVEFPSRAGPAAR